MKTLPPSQVANRGFTLLEVLITIIILAFGLLGLAGLQSRALNAEMESYQRAQALVIAQDMSDRIQTSMVNAADYAISGADGGYDGEVYVGTDSTADCDDLANDLARTDCAAWDSALIGTAEQIGTVNVGAMIGAKGCVSYDSSSEVSGLPGTGTYTVTVVWQGLISTSAPPATVACGVGTFRNPATGLVDDTFRRWVTMQFRVANQSVT